MFITNLNLYKVVRWVVKCFNTSQSISLIPYDKLLDKMTLVKKSVGVDEFLKINKSVRANLINFLSGNLERDPKVKCTKDGIPLFLGDFIPILRSGATRIEIYLLLTILYSTRSLKTEARPDISSITQPFSGDVTNLGMFSSSFWKELGYKPCNGVPKTLRSRLEVYRSKAGPNGHALMTALTDARALPKTLVTHLKTLGGPKLGYTLEKALSSEFFLSFHQKWMPNNDEGNFRRLSYFSDKEGKTRVIGILDYYSQIALKPLHTYLGNALKKIKQDCTFDQANFQKSLKGSRTYYSVDLSNATDRFPIQLIEILLKAQLPPSYVDSWKQTMVGYPFEFQGKYIKYSTGNPMGAYSSFNSFAFTHHYLIFYCCKVLGKSWKTLPYALLGDDIVIGDKDVGELYMKVIQSLGLEVSKLKTHKSDNFFEFAKRIFLNNEEVSPFPIASLAECSKSYSLLGTLIWELKRKGSLPSSERTVSSIVCEYFLLVKQVRRGLLKTIDENVFLIEGVLNSVHGLLPISMFFNELAEKFDYQHIINLDEYKCKQILKEVVIEAFSKSVNPNIFSFKFYNIPLAGMLTTFSQEWEKCKKENIHRLLPSERSVSIHDSPLWNAFKAVREEYSCLLTELTNSNRSGYDWSMKLKTFALPRNDKSILGRSTYLLAKSSNHFGKILKNRLLELNRENDLLKADNLTFTIPSGDGSEVSFIKLTRSFRSLTTSEPKL